MYTLSVAVESKKSTYSGPSAAGNKVHSKKYSGNSSTKVFIIKKVDILIVMHIL